MAPRKIVFSMILLTMLLPISNALAAKRTALVIGNSAYRAAPLKNPGNDARDIADTLEKLGFDVILNVDADKRAMVDSINSFARKLARSEVGIFYFAGHGMQINGANYLVPVRTRVSSESDVEFECIHAGRILGKMKEAGNRLNIVILDACRNNPFARNFRSSRNGLAKMDAPPGSIIAYATSPGSVAADGPGRNGTYTARLLKNLNDPGLTVQEVFNQTGLDVMSDTRDQQVPWMSSTPVPKFFLASGTRPPVPPQKEPAPKPRPESASRLVGDTWTEPKTGMVFVWIPKGCFQMGSDIGRDHEKPVHEVCLDGFWMGKYEVTNKEFRQFMPSHSSKNFKGADLNQDSQPAAYLTWKDAKAYVAWLSSGTGYQFSLPTEAQWEYAARAGGTARRYWGENLGNACHYANVHDRTSKAKYPNFTWASHACNDGYAANAPVGRFWPNKYGLFDMLGNVYEWCEDVYVSDAYSRHSRQNPVITSGGTDRVRRGGSWYNEPVDVSVSARDWRKTDQRFGSTGFRLVRKN